MCLAHIHTRMCQVCHSCHCLSPRMVPEITQLISDGPGILPLVQDPGAHPSSADHVGSTFPTGSEGTLPS